MTSDSPRFFESRAAFRAWLEQNHDKVAALEVGFYKKASGRPTVSYTEAVEEALCFGWIDGVRHTLDDVSFANRFTPRRPGSNWSAINIKRVESLTAQGLMHPAGLRAFEARQPDTAPYSYENPPESLPEPYLSQLKASRQAWDFFNAQPPSYRRIALFWVLSAKREETRLRRLQTLIADCEAGRRIALVTPRSKS